MTFPTSSRGRKKEGRREKEGKKEKPCLNSFEKRGKGKKKKSPEPRLNGETKK